MLYPEVKNMIGCGLLAGSRLTVSDIKYAYAKKKKSSFSSISRTRHFMFNDTKTTLISL